VASRGAPDAQLVGTGSRKGASAPSRAADVASQPAVWIVFAAALALTGPRGRRAALRGAACSTTASLIHLPLKRVFGRPRPRHAGRGPIGPVTSSFPSGHTASDLGFMFGAAQELPVLLLLPLSVATLGSHWSLIRSRKYYPSDVIAGGALALAVSAIAWKLRPPRHAAKHAQIAPQPADDHRQPPPHPRKRAAMRFLTNRLLNPITRPLLARGLWPRTQALIETTGRVSGRPRRVPVGNGLRGTASGSSPSVDRGATGEMPADGPHRRSSAATLLARRDRQRVAASRSSHGGSPSPPPALSTVARRQRSHRLAGRSDPETRAPRTARARRTARRSRNAVAECSSDHAARVSRIGASTGP
jgi:membrane-associated phospholipid phosphatase